MFLDKKIRGLQTWAALTISVLSVSQKKVHHPKFKLLLQDPPQSTHQSFKVSWHNINQYFFVTLNKSCFNGMKLSNLLLSVQLNSCNVFLIMIYSAYSSNLKITTLTKTNLITKPNVLRRCSILLIGYYMGFDLICNRAYNGCIMLSNK